MSEGTISAKRGATTRFHETAAIGDPPAGADLTGKTIRVVLAANDATVTLTDGTGLGLTVAASGTWWWEVTAANLAALADPDTITVWLTIFNADNSVFMEDAITIGVSW